MTVKPEYKKQDSSIREQDSQVPNNLKEPHQSRLCFSIKHKRVFLTHHICPFLVGCSFAMSNISVISEGEKRMAKSVLTLKASARKYHPSFLFTFQ